jgi:hypothetical protein
VVGGGYNNVIKPFAYSATIAGGYQNTIGTNSHEATISGGFANLIGEWSDYAIIAGGDQNVILGDAARTIVGGGYRNQVQAYAYYATIPGGRDASAFNYGQLAFASGMFGASGDAQTSGYVLRITSTNADPAELFLDGGRYNRQIQIPVNGRWTFEAIVVGSTLAGDTAGFRVQGVLKSVGGTCAFVGTPSVISLAADAGAASWQIAVDVDDSADALRFIGTGSPGFEVRWVAHVRTAELRF